MAIVGKKLKICRRSPRALSCIECRFFLLTHFYTRATSPLGIREYKSRQHVNMSSRRRVKWKSFVLYEIFITYCLGGFLAASIGVPEIKRGGRKKVEKLSRYASNTQFTAFFQKLKISSDWEWKWGGEKGKKKGREKRQRVFGSNVNFFLTQF